MLGGSARWERKQHSKPNTPRAQAARSGSQLPTAIYPLRALGQEGAQAKRLLRVGDIKGNVQVLREVDREKRGLQNQS